MTYREAARSALDVQDAVNLSGVAYSFLDAIRAINDEGHNRGEGSNWRNTHPIVTLFLDKMCDLNGYSAKETLAAEYKACELIAKGEANV